MELSQFTDYALRVLIFTGLQSKPEAGRLVSVREISAAYSISQNHLVKVAHRLSQLGYLKTVRGRNGGIALGKPSHEINVGKVVRQTENLAVVECLGPDGICCLSPACELKRALARARDAFLKTLDSYSLADLLAPRKALLATLEISSVA